MDKLIEAKRQLYSQIKDIPGVEGVGSGEQFLWLYFSYISNEDLIPKEVNGFPVVWNWTGKMRSYGRQ